MEIPKVVKCPDRHFRHAIFSLGPYIADYPEQVWLAGVVQDCCPKYDPLSGLLPQLTRSLVDVMPYGQTSMAKGVTVILTKRQTFSSKTLTPEYFGMISESGMILWYVVCL
jgi:hypothetical protein